MVGVGGRVSGDWFGEAGSKGSAFVMVSLKLVELRSWAFSSGGVAVVSAEIVG